MLFLMAKMSFLWIETDFCSCFLVTIFGDVIWWPSDHHYGLSRDCLMTAWWLPDDRLMTTWWLPDDGHCRTKNIFFLIPKCLESTFNEVKWKFWIYVLCWFLFSLQTGRPWKWISKTINLNIFICICILKKTTLQCQWRGLELPLQGPVPSDC